MGKTVEECYEVLGLKYGATEDEIRSAYRKNALKCHPDKNPDDPLSTQKFQELGHAYRRLTGKGQFLSKLVRGEQEPDS
ncbi:hypothetical protein OS493_010333 [Desmophyllum pertusum]|uniref:J domain-containing protein n=1 Tax=Desmophyllum pertusum TaxID=174260 RepID=A0A9X0D9V5_9CNID|nr:hypothetical protein OS493_010333 [Desmophyllum pertusum]